MYHIVFMNVSKGETPYRKYVFFGTSIEELANQIVTFLLPCFEQTLAYFSRQSGKSLSLSAPNLTETLRTVPANCIEFSQLRDKVQKGIAFKEKDFMSSFEFTNNGKTFLWCALSGTVYSGFRDIRDGIDTYLYSQGLDDKLPSNFLATQDEEQLISLCRDILNAWNEEQGD